MNKFNTILASLLAYTVFCFSCRGYAQDISLNHLPQPDMSLPAHFCNLEGEILIVKTEVKDTVRYNELLSRCKGVCTSPGPRPIRHELELVEDDHEKRMIICGPIADFKKWNSFELPIERIKNGFRLGTYTFTHKDDGIFFISSDGNKFVFTGNSLTAIDKLLRSMFGFYQYQIVQNGIITHFGHLIDDRFDAKGHLDLEKERARYLPRRLESAYYVFHYSKRVPEFETIKSKAIQLDDFCNKALIDLELTKPVFKIPCYIYSSETEKFIFTGFPGGGAVTYGRDIHSLGFGSIEHETVHALFNNLVSEPSGNFFNEGIQQYYEQKIYPEVLARDKELSKKYMNEPIEKWANDSINFFSTPSENGRFLAYPISGLFVKYLLENYGLSKFKEFYIKTDTESGFEEVYGETLKDVVMKWKVTAASW